MAYTLGIDLGTTYTSAAVARDGRAVTIPLGNHGASIPSVVFVQPDGTALVGHAAARRGAVEPERMAREFKRRVGDTQPLLIGGASYSPEQLGARLLRSVFDEVTARDGSPPTRLAITHPGNWGPYKTDLMRQAVEMSNITIPYDLVTEPAAAAVFYAEQDANLSIGDTIAVYDLGGGTFDVAILSVTATGFELRGEPSGIERFGGIDLDAAVLAHVMRTLGPAAEMLDRNDEATTIALQRLREECTSARELLSVDTTASIPVLLPGVNTSIPLSRVELEAMARPGLDETINAMHRALASANTTPDQLHSIVLVGGTARMPLVTQLIQAAFQRPVALTSDPTHAVALGAALTADGANPSTDSGSAPATGVSIATDPSFTGTVLITLDEATAMPAADAASPVVPPPVTSSEATTVAPRSAPSTTAPSMAVPPPLAKQAPTPQAQPRVQPQMQQPQQSYPPQGGFQQPDPRTSGQNWQAPQGAPQRQSQQIPSQPKPKRTGRKILIALVVLALLAAGGFVAYTQFIDTDSDSIDASLALIGATYLRL